MRRIDSLLELFPAPPIQDAPDITAQGDELAMAMGGRIYECWRLAKRAAQNLREAEQYLAEAEDDAMCELTNMVPHALMCRYRAKAAYSAARANLRRALAERKL